MVKSFSQNVVKYQNCGVYFMDGIDGKHCGVHHRKYFLPVTQPFWKRPEDVIKKVETRSQLQKKKVFFGNMKNKYFNYVRTKGIKNRSSLSSYSESDEYTDDESTDSESSGCFETALIGSSDNDSEQTDSEQTVLPDEIKSSLKNMIKETIADKNVNLTLYHLIVIFNNQSRFFVIRFV